MGGCVSSNEVQENDPPIEKTEAVASHNIPEIQINGPSNSPSKENGLSNNHHATPPPPAAKPETPQKPQQNGYVEEPKTPVVVQKKPEPLFPHVSPFKPQFDYKRDVTLSPRASRYLDMNESETASPKHNSSPSSESYKQQNRDHGADDDLTGTYMECDDSSKPLDDSSHGDTTEHRKHTTILTDEDGNKKVTTTIETTTRRVVEEVRTENDNTSAPEVTPVEEGEKEKTVSTTIHTITYSTEEGGGGTAEEVRVTKDAKSEDRSAILESFLANQAEPEVATSDDESFVVRRKKSSEDASQVEDDDMQASKQAPHPLVETKTSEEKEGGGNDGKGDTSESMRPALARSKDESGEEIPFTPEDRTKINELLNEIEAVAEKNGLFPS